MPYHPSPEVTATLGPIAAKIAAATPIQRWFKRTPAFLGTLSSGELCFDSELQLDTDGYPGGAGHLDPTHQSQTSLRYSGGGSLDANRVPYIVLPSPAPWLETLGIRTGDYAVVLYKNHKASAVVGDRGGENKLGEGSLKLFCELGQERLNDAGDVRDVGMGPGVFTIVFPSSGHGQRHFANEAALLADLNQSATARWNAFHAG